MRDPDVPPPTTELAHIVPWSKVKEHTSTTLIALCPHVPHPVRQRRDRSSIAARTSATSGLLTSRYSETERRLLDLYASGDLANRTFLADRPMDFDFMYLLEDGFLLKPVQTAAFSITFDDGRSIPQGPTQYILTDKGLSSLSVGARVLRWTITTTPNDSFR